MTTTMLWRSSYILILLIIFMPIPSISASLGILEKIVHTGDLDGWDGVFSQDAYWLENQDNPGAIRYYYAPYSKADEGRRTISLDVKIDHGDPDSAAGLLYGYDTRKRHYFLVVLSSDGKLEIFRRDESGFNLLMSSTTDASPAGFDRITLRENGNKLSFSVNGRNLGGIGNEHTGKGAVGIVAVGTGRFGFAKFKVSASAGQSVAKEQGGATQSALSQSPPGSLTSSQETKYSQATQNAEIQWFVTTDPETGMWIEKIPYPTNWRMTDQFIVGPGDARTREITGYTSYQERTIDQMINGELLPWLRKENYRILNIETYSVLVNKFKEDYSEYWVTELAQNDYSVKGIEYEDNNGLKGLLIVYFIESRSELSNSNSYYISIMESDASYYDNSKSAFLFAEENKRINPEYMAIVNQEERRLKSWINCWPTLSG